MTLNNLKYFFKLIIFLIVISYAIDKVLFVSLNKISDKVLSGESIGKLNHYLQIKDSVDFIIYGSSRANHNINPTHILKNSFNMGLDGQMMAFSYALCKLLPKDKPQIVLFHIDPKNAFDNNYDGSDISNLKSKYNRNEIIRNEINKLNQDTPLQEFYWSISYNGILVSILKNYFKPKYDYKNYFGYDPIYVSKEQKLFLNNILNNKSKPCTDTYKLNPIYDRLLNEIKVFCKKNNKTLIFFTSPTFNDKCKEDNHHFREIMKNRELKYFDYTDLFIETKSLEYWKDKTHLSNIGAEKFTIEINKLIAK